MTPCVVVADHLRLVNLAHLELLYSRCTLVHQVVNNNLKHACVYLWMAPKRLQ